jgi:hypothetical protein
MFPLRNNNINYDCSVVFREVQILYTSSIRQMNLCWNFRTIYGGYRSQLSRKRVAVPARQATGGIDFLESIPGLLKSLKIPSLHSFLTFALQLKGVPSLKE